MECWSNGKTKEFQHSSTPIPQYMSCNTAISQEMKVLKNFITKKAYKVLDLGRGQACSAEVVSATKAGIALGSIEIQEIG